MNVTPMVAAAFRAASSVKNSVFGAAVGSAEPRLLQQIQRLAAHGCFLQDRAASVRTQMDRGGRMETARRRARQGEKRKRDSSCHAESQPHSTKEAP